MKNLSLKKQIIGLSVISLILLAIISTYEAASTSKDALIMSNDKRCLL